MTKLSSKSNSGKGSRATPGEPAKSTPRTPVVARAVHQPGAAAPKASQPAPAAKQAVAAKRSTPWTVEAASRVYRSSALENGGQVPEGSFAAGAMSRATKGAPPPKSRTK